MTWRERVIEARTRGRFTQAEKALARGWSSCAVGEQQQSHPSVIVYSNGKRPWEAYQCPVDYTLCLLGHAFFVDVDNDEFSSAERVLARIEDRVLELKRDTEASKRYQL